MGIAGNYDAPRVWKGESDGKQAPNCARALATTRLELRGGTILRNQNKRRRELMWHNPKKGWGITTLIIVVVLLATIVLSACSSNTPTSSPGNTTGQSTGQVTLTLFGAGTLAGPFKDIDAAFTQANPDITIQAQFGGSVSMAKQITQLHKPADILAVADYNVIPKYLYSQNGSQEYANWYIGFASNAVTWMYTDKSKGAGNITSDNWYQVLSQPGVEIGRSNPDTDPSGYQTLQMLQLASKYYNVPDLEQNILNNSPQQNIRDTETDLIAALEAGQIDYLGIYTSTAIQDKFNYLKLPPQINLSDPSMAAQYATASVQTSSGNVPGSPIIYAITIPTNAPNSQAAQQFIKFLISSQGQAIMQQDGFQPLNPAIAQDWQNVPTALQSVVKAWPTITPTATPSSTP